MKAKTKKATTEIENAFGGYVLPPVKKTYGIDFWGST
jgi:hypothetical protein